LDFRPLSVAVAGTEPELEPASTVAECEFRLVGDVPYWK
jgi:hypothetical protein